jgi:hypothetical protein
VLEPAGEGWTFEWRTTKSALGVWAQIKTSDHSTWIVTPPRSMPGRVRSIPHPCRPHPRLKNDLFNAWYGAMVAAARPERAHERREALLAMQILKALEEAVKRGGPQGARVIERMEALARPYLAKLWFDERTPKHSQGLKLVHDRAAAVTSLADRWARYFPPHALAPDEALDTADEFIRDVRTGSIYAGSAAELPVVENAGPGEARKLADAYRKAVQAVQETLTCLVVFGPVET